MDNNKDIDIDRLIKESNKRGVDFGKSDPYNRLRYYTKIGWLPHMVRKSVKNGEIKGHYPEWVVDRLILIESLKNKGLTNEQISEQIIIKDKLISFKKLLSSKEVRNQIISYSTLAILLLIFSLQVGIINIGRGTGNTNNRFSTGVSSINIFDSGTAFIPKNKRTIFVKSEHVQTSRKIYVTFNTDYSPASRYWISKIENSKGFYIDLDTPVSQNAEFNWWISN